MQVRTHIWDTSSFEAYIHLLQDPLYFVDILHCFKSWLHEQPEIMGVELGIHIKALVNVFTFENDGRVSSKSFQKALAPLVSIVQEFPSLSLLMVDNGAIALILPALERQVHPYTRSQLLLILLFFVLPYQDGTNLPDRAALVRVIGAISSLAQGRVKEICITILKALN